MIESRSMAGCALLLALAATPLNAQQRVPLPARDNVLTGQPVSIYTVGKEEGEAYELFGSVGSVGFDAQDNLFVLDRGNHRITVFDARGRYVRTIGRRGEGPGEFTAPVAMSVADDGSIVVADLARASLSVFDAAGNYRSVALPPDGGRPAAGGAMFRDAGGVVMRTMNINPEALTRGAATMNTPITRFSLNGDAARATALFDIQQPAPAVSNQQGRTMVVMSPPLFTPQPFWGLLPGGGIAVAADATYTIRIADGSGRVQRIVERPITPRRVTREDRERGLEQRASARASGGFQTVRMGPGGTTFGGGEATRAPNIDELLRTTEFADVIPVISRFSVDRFGRMWVARSGRRVGDAGPIDLIAADGRYIGTLNGQAIPDAVSASGVAAYIVTDDLGINRVAVRRLPDGWR
jgi:hypothetical protein